MHLVFFSQTPQPPRSTLFPYTTLFRSALSKHAIEGVAAADWPTNRAAWLGGQIACNISWQDSGTQATRPDQSKIRSEEHTSELQSHVNIVCRLLLENKTDSFRNSCIVP